MIIWLTGEQRRRSRINEKMKALQNLIPNSNKVVCKYVSIYMFEFYSFELGFYEDAVKNG